MHARNRYVLFAFSGISLALDRPKFASLTLNSGTDVDSRMKVRVILTGAITLAYFASAAADMSFRCDSHLIDVGDAREDVLKYCGEPTTNAGYTWTYDRGTSGLNVIVYFSPDGTVNRMQDAEEVL
jgi:hypothetical protein